MDIEIVKLDLTDPKIIAAVEPFADLAKDRIRKVVKQCWDLNMHFTQEMQTAMFLTILPNSLQSVHAMIAVGVDARVAPMAPSIIFKNLIEECKRELAQQMAPGELKRIRSESAN